MTDGVRPVGPVGNRDRRAAQRREAERRAETTGRSLVPVEGEGVQTHSATPADPTPPADPAAAFSAQLMGQSGQRKGLKGGPPVLNAARARYLGNEYSGEKELRPPAGLVKKTDV